MRESAKLNTILDKHLLAVREKRQRQVNADPVHIGMWPHAASSISEIYIR